MHTESCKIKNDVNANQLDFTHGDLLSLKVTSEMGIVWGKCMNKDHVLHFLPDKDNKTAY